MSIAVSHAAHLPQPAATTVDELAQCAARLAAYLKENWSRLQSEAAAKTALVQPFIRALGYNVNDLAEVVPEFTADHGLKKGEKVDFALMRGDAVALLVECKMLDAELSIAHCGQLSRYFHNTDASFGLLTDGNRYRFYSDLEKPNVMDDRPFFEFRLDAHARADVAELLQFGRNSFEVERNRESALRLKRLRLLGAEIGRELDEPSDELVSLFAKRVHEGNTTSTVRRQFAPLIHQAIEAQIDRRVEQRLQSALSKVTVEEHVEASSEAQAPSDAEPDVLPEAVARSLEVLREILDEAVDGDRIVAKVGTQYTAFMLDARSHRTLVRLRIRRKKLVAELCLPAQNLILTLTTPEHFRDHGEHLLAALHHRLEAN